MLLKSSNEVNCIHIYVKTIHRIIYLAYIIIECLKIKFLFFSLTLCVFVSFSPAWQFEFCVDKENDIELKTAALHKELDYERSNQQKLRNEIGQLQAQLQESKAGLMAATRLSDQLELNQLTIDKLNNESKFFYPY